ncbi:MAG TPA: hypothetical protein VL974_00860 [Magnetospirillum sp.]|jgi:hypothetical protein|nr:hypothetical protein [Magnetospirillum sp.]
MISVAEIAAGLTGALRLARRDPAGLAMFDATPQGFWRSFWAAVLVAPAFVILDMLSGDIGGGPRQLAIQMIGYVIDWTAFPVLMITIADSLGKWPNYMRYIVAYNWAALVQMTILLPVAILAVLVPGHATMALAQFVTVILLVYRAYVAHVALEVGVGTAAGVVLLDVLLAALLKAVSDKLMAM